MPRFSVIMPAYNSRAFIGRAIESVLEQTYRPHEIIVIDDGSTDGTADWIEASFGDRVRCFRKENEGPAKARNLAARLATGDWLAFLDSDDWWFAEKLASQARSICDDPSVVFAASGFIHHSAAQSEPMPMLVRDTGELLKSLLLRTTVLLSSVAVRRETFLAVGGFSEELYCGEDRELWARLAVAGRLAAHVDPLVWKADRPLSLSNDPLVVLRDGSHVNERVCHIIGTHLNKNTFARQALYRKAASELNIQVFLLMRARGAYPQAAAYLARSVIEWPFSSWRAVRFAAALLRTIVAHVRDPVPGNTQPLPATSDKPEEAVFVKRDERTGRILSNSLWTAIDMGVGLVVAVLSSVLVARTFGPEVLGHYSYIMWLIMMTSLVGRTGIPTAARRYFAQRLARHDIHGARRVFKALLTAQSAVAAATVLVALGMVEFTMPEGFHLVGILGVLAILPGMVMGVISALNSALERLGPNSQASIISQVLYISGIFGAIKLGFGLEGVIGSLLASRILDLLLRIGFSRTALRRILVSKTPANEAPLGPEEKRDLTRFIIQAVALQIVGIVVWDRSEMIFLKSFSPTVELAFYSIPFTMTLSVFQAQGAFATAATTSLFVVYNECEQAARAMLAVIVKYMAVIAFPLSLGLAAVSNPLMHILYGEQYVQAIPVLMLVAFFGPARSLFIPGEQYLIVSNRQDLLIYTTIGAAVVDLIMCITLIPTWGSIGAGWSNGIAQIAAMVLVWTGLRRMGVRVSWGAPARIGLSAILMFLAALSLSNLFRPLVALYAAVIGGALTYVFALRVTCALDEEDLRRLLSVAQRVPGPLRSIYEQLVRFVTKTPAAVRSESAKSVASSS